MFARLRRRLTYANVMATVAVFIALGGTSYAALVITGKNVRNSSLTGADLKNESVTTADIKNGSLLTKDFKAGQLSNFTAASSQPAPAGPKGDTGSQGAKGETGATGPQGPSGSPDTAADILTKLQTVDGSSSGLDADRLDGLDSSNFLAQSGVPGKITRQSTTISVAPGATTATSVTCNGANARAVGGGAHWGGSNFLNLSEGNTGVLNASNVFGEGTWYGVGTNDEADALGLTVYVICANP